jgi:hypothetical protein
MEVRLVDNSKGVLSDALDEVLDGASSAKVRIPAIAITCSGGRRSPGPAMAIAHRSGATLGFLPFSLLDSCSAHHNAV